MSVIYPPSDESIKKNKKYTLSGLTETEMYILEWEINNCLEYAWSEKNRQDKENLLKKIHLIRHNQKK